MRPDFPQTLDGLGFSAFHVARSVLSVAVLFDLFYHGSIALDVQGTLLENACRPWALGVVLSDFLCAL